MFNKRVVQIALKHTRQLDDNPGLTVNNAADNQSSVISQLIYDIFGGEILKTHKKKGWHFYNRINGKSIDFTRSETGLSSGCKRFEDIPSSPEETFNYYVKEDYSTFLMRFIRAFEENIGLKKHQPHIS